MWWLVVVERGGVYAWGPRANQFTGQVASPFHHLLPLTCTLQPPSPPSPFAPLTPTPPCISPQVVEAPPDEGEQEALNEFSKLEQKLEQHLSH